MLLAYRGELAEGSGAYAERRLRRRGCGASAVLSTPRRRRRGVGRACQEPLSGATLAAAWRARIEDHASRSVLFIEDAKSSGY